MLFLNYQKKNHVKKVATLFLKMVFKTYILTQNDFPAIFI